MDDPTQQPFRITQTNESEMNEEPAPASHGRKKSYKNRPAYVDISDKDARAELITASRTTSTAEAHPPPPQPKKSQKHRGSTSGAMMLSGADFGASPGGF